jgi:hypothetical protein
MTNLNAEKMRKALERIAAGDPNHSQFPVLAISEAKAALAAGLELSVRVHSGQVQKVLEAARSLLDEFDANDDNTISLTAADILRDAIESNQSGEDTSC